MHCAAPTPRNIGVQMLAIKQCVNCTSQLNNPICLALSNVGHNKLTG